MAIFNKKYCCTQTSSDSVLGYFSEHKKKKKIIKLRKIKTLAGLMFHFIKCFSNIQPPLTLRL